MEKHQFIIVLLKYEPVQCKPDLGACRITPTKTGLQIIILTYYLWAVFLIPSWHKKPTMPLRDVFGFIIGVLSIYCRFYVSPLLLVHIKAYFPVWQKTLPRLLKCRRLSNLPNKVLVLFLPPGFKGFIIFMLFNAGLYFLCGKGLISS